MMGEAAQDDNGGEEAQGGGRRRAGYGVREARVPRKKGTERFGAVEKLEGRASGGSEQTHRGEAGSRVGAW
jgi:hypothetical protein